MKLACCVVLYNPDAKAVENIKTYAPYVGEVFAVDNSDEPDEDLIRMIEAVGDNVRVIPMNGNKGIAAGLNVGLREASLVGYKYLLTMDDDSYFTGTTLQDYLVEAQKLFEKDPKVIQVGIHNSGDKDDDKVVNREDPEWLITSGSVMDVESSIAVGGFLEKLFIDEVDREFCYRAASKGYLMRRVLKYTMQHNLGTPIRGKFLGRSYEAMGHSKVRKYYIFRNCTYVMKEYPQTRKPYRYFLFTQFVKTILAEDDKWNKIRFMIRGRADARRGKFGKLEV
ncbi:MAG: glycosyltransferase [Clostridiales bacterium]|nr:glycosyltransferase [Clostridiales bacterium]